VSGVERTRFARAPRKTVWRQPSDAFALLNALSGDRDFRKLRASTQAALYLAATRFADRTGAFWPKVATWAAECETSPSTVERAIREAVHTGVLEREPYLRPNGTQGSTTYRFRADLVDPQTPTEPKPTRSVISDGASHAMPSTQRNRGSDAPSSGISDDGQTSPLGVDAPEQKFEQKKEQAEILRISDFCMVCNRTTDHEDDGCRCVCIRCREAA
jgi:hypothetical protein